MDEEDDLDLGAPTPPSVERSDESAPDFIPAGQEPWAAAPAPDFIPAGKEPWAEAPDFIPAGQEPWAPEAESELGSFTRAAAHAAVPAIGSLPAMAYGAGIGTALGGPVGGVIGGAVGALGGGFLIAKAQEAALNALGFDDSAQRAANEMTNPKSSFAGELAPNLAAFRPGKLADSLASRLLGGGLMGGLEAGQELATEGHIDPTKTAMAGGFGVVANQPTRFGRSVMGIGERLVSRPGEGAPLPPAPTPAEDQATAARSEPTKTSIGIAQDQPRPSENVTGIGNEASAPERSERYYEKRRQRIMGTAEEGVTELAPGEIPAEQHAAESSKANVPETSGGSNSPEPPSINPPVPEPTGTPAVSAGPTPERPPSAGAPEALVGQRPAPQGQLPPERVAELREQARAPDTFQGRRVLEDLSRTEPVQREIPAEGAGNKPTIDRVIEIARQQVELDPTNETMQKMLTVLEKARGNPKLAEVVADRFLAYTKAQEAKARASADVTAPEGVIERGSEPAAPVADKPPTPAPEPGTRTAPVSEGRSGSGGVASPADIRRLPIEGQEAAPAKITEKTVFDSAGRPVGQANSVALARRRTAMLKLAKEVQDRHPLPDTDISKPEQVKALRKAASAALEDAESNGYKHYGPRQKKSTEAGPKPHLEAPPEALWMAEVKAFVTGKKKAEDFVVRERLLRAGDETSADIVREDRAADNERARRTPEVTSEGNLKPIDTMAGEENKSIPVRVSGHGRRIDVTPIETRKLSDAMPKFEGDHIAQEIVRTDPNVTVHTLPREEIARVGKAYGAPGLKAFYDGIARNIYVAPDANREIILHEAVHAVTANKMRANPAMAALVRRVMNLATEANPLLHEFRNAMVNEHEFLAWGMSNNRFQTALAETRLSPDVARMLGSNKLTDGFKAFVDAVRRVLGLTPEQYTGLEAVVRLTDLVRHLPEEPVGRRVDTDMMRLDPMIAGQADDLIKQVRGPWGLKLRGMNYLAQASDRIFGADNPAREVHTAVEKARVKSLQNAHADEPFLRDMLELRQRDPQGWQDMQSLMADEAQYQVFGDVPLKNQKLVGADKKWREDKFPDLESRWNALPADAKDMRARAYDFYEDRHKALTADIANNRLFKDLGFTDMPLVERILNGSHTEADFQRLGADDRIRQANLETIQAVGERGHLAIYTPAVRTGSYVVTGLYKPVGMEQAKQIDKNNWEFKTKQEAEDAAVQQHGRAKVQGYYVDKTTGDRYYKVTEEVTRGGQPVLDPQGNPRTYQKEVPYAKGDPNTEQRYGVHVERGYMSQHDLYRDARVHHGELEGLDIFEKLDLQPKRYNPKTDAVTLASNFANLEEKLQHVPLYEKMSAAQRETVKQALAEHYLNMQAATRVHNSRLHRNFIPGASDDLISNTALYSQESGDRMAQLEFRPKMDAAMERMAEITKQDPKLSAARQAVWNEFAERLNGMKDGGYNLASGQMSPGLHRLLSWSYTARLATPGFTIRNLTQPWLFTLPEVGSRHGFAAAGRELMRVYRDIGAGSILKGGAVDTGRAAKGKLTDPQSFLADIRSRIRDPGEKALLDEAVTAGHLDPDAGFQVSQFLRREGGPKLDFRFGRSHGAVEDTALTRGVTATAGAADKALHWVEEVSRQMPRAAEVINRSTTLLAAYRLEMKKTNGNVEASKRYALDTVDRTQFRYTDTNKPGWQRHPFARAAFQFKQFGQSTMEFMGRHMGNAIRAETDPETRKASLKALGGLFVAHTIVAGALGLPWEPVRALLIGAKATGLTDLDWDNVENGIREGLTGFGKLAGLNEKHAKKLGEVLSRGLPRLAGIDMSPGLGIDNLLLFGSPRSGTDRDMDNNLMAWLFQMAGGAPASLVLQMLHGMRDIMGGEYAKGAEKLMPMKIGSDVLKAGAGYAEGKVNARGRQTMPPYNAAEAGAKAMGLPVASEAEDNAFKRQVYNAGDQERQQRSKAIAGWLKAETPAAKDKAAQAAFAVGLEPKDLTAALDREKSADKRVLNGVVTTKITRPIAERASRVYNVPTVE